MAQSNTTWYNSLYFQTGVWKQKVSIIRTDFTLEFVSLFYFSSIRTTRHEKSCNSPLLLSLYCTSAGGKSARKNSKDPWKPQKPGGCSRRSTLAAILKQRSEININLFRFGFKRLGVGAEKLFVALWSGFVHWRKIRDILNLALRNGGILHFRNNHRLSF